MNILNIEKLRKEYGAIIAVNDLSFSVESGQVLGLIGPNGAGKTTLLRMLATLLSPTSGKINIMGQDATRDYLNIRSRIGYMPDFFNLYNDLTLSECVEFFARAYNIEQSRIPGLVNEMLHYVELHDRRDQLVKNLSRGMVQRLGVAALLAHEPDLFLLDEPASGLDPKARIQLRNVLKKLSGEGRTVVISSHILTELSGFCTHIAIMDRGKMRLFGSVDEIERKIQGSRRVSISVVDRCDEAVSCVKSFGDTHVLDVNGNSITLETTMSLPELAEINSALVKKGIKVVQFTEDKTNLEDLFMKISSENDNGERGI